MVSQYEFFTSNYVTYMGHHRPLFIFVFFKQTLQFLQQINVKNVHPVYSAGIRTHNIQNLSLIP